MGQEKILVPTDLSDAAGKAVEFGAFIARSSGSGITLLHIHEDKGTPMTDSEITLRKGAYDICSEADVDCEYRVVEGKIFSEIPKVAAEEGFTMMVIATHGVRGLRQKLLGADILKLIRSVPIPVLVVQKGTRLQREGFKNILFPVGGHASFNRKTEATIRLAKLFGSEVQVYSIEKPGFEHTDQLKKNIEEAMSAFEKNGVKYERVNESQSVYSVGYAKQTLQYAERNGSDLIAIVSVPTEEFYYFADSDKETLLTNSLNVPVLCTSDKNT